MSRLKQNQLDFEATPDSPPEAFVAEAARHPVCLLVDATVRLAPDNLPQASLSRSFNPRQILMNFSSDGLTPNLDNLDFSLYDADLTTTVNLSKMQVVEKMVLGVRYALFLKVVGDPSERTQ